ncbi:CPBP family intramembrane glutamic endopeptidase [Flavobacterium sp. CLA17]|uniref:CPBP family intramembrane glutamic endopeptidase n=1 Tax=Flavobacterium sp. CLA17 TaxID=2724135 RepID=UPI001491650E|nr:CPBP family intramembrane glutamic endopeptidase [Flavobacterium sp. CLA17]QSB29102.1 CPBP family intramembrane metalloprotease [Flavobacterium sp. CLA17]
MYDSFKTAFLDKEWSVSLIVITGLMPFIVYFSLIGFQLIEVDDTGTWDIEILVYFILLFLSALLEEILFRFIPYTMLIKNPSLKDVLLVSLLFSVFHIFNSNINVIGIVNLIIAGVLFSLIYLKTNSILVVSFIHAFWNFAIGCLLGSNISGIKIESVFKYKPLEPFFLSGGYFGFEGSVLTGLAFLIFCVFLYHQKPNGFEKVYKPNEH